MKQALVGALLIVSGGCQDQPEAFPVRSLIGSGDVSYVCRAPDGGGRSIEECPDFESQENALYALVTQTLTAEVAVIDLTRGRVVDADRSSPGFTSLRVGQKPIDIVSTPGGQVSFVGVAGVGSEGIFALPTSCVGPPGEKSPGVLETPRDFTTWPACSLPTAPGDMAVLIDPPDEAGLIRLSCASDTRVDEQPEPISATRSECQVDLRKETRQPGRRKLAVALPAFGEIAIIDAQTLLDEHAPGTFMPCPIETTHRLGVELPSEPIEQRLPEDLTLESCTPFSVEYPPPRGEFRSEPAGFSLADGSLFVADTGAPVIHELDVRDPCNVQERAPLLPRSLEEPTRVVTTTKVAVSPTLTDGRRFLYAIDEFGRATANVMAFDLTPGQVERTPLVRPGSPFLPFEPPDRISFVAPAQDIVFARRDLPIADSVIGEAVVGTFCDPDPELDLDAPGARYRPNSSLTDGASPSNLRGVFAFVLLSSGQVGVVDVEDYDAPCRRPIQTNPEDQLDFRGCANDPAQPEYFTLPDGQDPAGQRTVTDEVSCRIVQPHMARASRLAVTSSSNGAGAPSLRSFPRLTLEDRGLPMNNSEEGVNYPKMLAVDYPNPDNPLNTVPASTYVGTTLYSTDDTDRRLETDPRQSERGAVVLPWVEPRAYAPEERILAVYEGSIGSERGSGFLKIGESDSDSVRDSSARFCSAGVQGMELARQVGEERFSLSGGALRSFARRHADYVQVTQDLLGSDDSYWQSEQGRSCGGDRGFVACEEAFGRSDSTDELPSTRELRILAAFQDHLVVEPRHLRDAEEQQRRMELLDCCFPSGTRYVVRASDQWVVQGSATGLRHRVVPTRVTGDDGQLSFPCAFDCSPTKQFFESRAYEVSAERSDVCTTVPVDINEPGAEECIFKSLTSRFAIYGGESPSERGMTFFYDVTGGFRPLSINLTRNDTSTILPQTLTLVPGVDMLASVDALDRGLMLLSLDTLGVAAPSPFF